jgi:hypothetical protein
MEERRRNDQVILQKIDNLSTVVGKIKIDTAVICEKIRVLESHEAGNRLTKIETRNKMIAIIGGVLLGLTVTKEWIAKIVFG